MLTLLLAPTPGFRPAVVRSLDGAATSRRELLVAPSRRELLVAAGAALGLQGPLAASAASNKKRLAPLQPELSEDADDAAKEAAAAAAAEAAAAVEAEGITPLITLAAAKDAMEVRAMPTQSAGRNRPTALTRPAERS